MQHTAQHVAAGDHLAKLELACTRDGENTPVRVVAGGGRILADTFVPLP